MTDQYVPPLRQRFLEDMRIKGLQPKTQTMYLRAMRDFTLYLGHSPDAATPEELRAFQLDMKERGIGAPTFNNRLTVLSFFFATTCPRPLSAGGQEDPRRAECRGSLAHSRGRTGARPQIPGGVQRGLWRRAQGERGHTFEDRRHRQRPDADPD